MKPCGCRWFCWLLCMAFVIVSAQPPQLTSLLESNASTLADITSVCTYDYRSISPQVLSLLYLSHFVLYFRISEFFIDVFNKVDFYER